MSNQNTAPLSLTQAQTPGKPKSLVKSSQLRGVEGKLWERSMAELKNKTVFCMYFYRCAHKNLWLVLLDTPECKKLLEVKPGSGAFHLISFKTKLPVILHSPMGHHRGLTFFF